MPLQKKPTQHMDSNAGNEVRKITASQFVGQL